ncbi:TerD family protein [Streptomyces sp. S6]
MPHLMATGQQVPLSRADGRPLTLMRMGIGWQRAPRPGLLGALGRRRGRFGTFALLYGEGRFVDVLFTENPVHPEGSVEHVTGLVVEDTADVGDNESFFARLPRLSPHADRVVFVVSSLDGGTFETVHRAHCRLVDESLGRELARYAFPAAGPHTALVMAELTRTADAWTMTAVGRPLVCPTFTDLREAVDGLAA